jgi:hypothetical protein
MATGMHYGASKTIFQYAEELRKNMTEKSYLGKALQKINLASE